MGNFNNKTMRKVLFFTGAVLFSLQVQAQITPTAAPPEPTVIVVKDPRLDLLIAKQEQVNKLTEKYNKEHQTTMKGFRLQVLNTNNYKQAVTEKTRMYQTFPELKAYMQYLPPYYKLQVGNFKSREEAINYKKKVSKLYPNGVYIIPAVIEVKPEKVNAEEDEKENK
jgi:SPOR domain